MATALFAPIIDNISESIIVLSANSHVVYTNKAFQKLVGYTMEQLADVPLTKFFSKSDPDNKIAYASLFSQFSSPMSKEVTNCKRSCEGVILTKKTALPVELTFYKRVIDESTYMIIRIVDISERKKTELELLRVEAKYDSILRTAVDAIIVITSEGLIEEFNPAAEKLTGYTYNEVRGQNVSIFMTSRYSHSHDSYLKNYLKTGIRKIIGIGREVTLKRRDGSVIPIDLSVSAMTIGEEVKFTGIIRDVTERKRMERLMIEQANQIALTAQISSRTKSEFLGLMSHELRTPLNVVLGMASMLADTDLQPDQREAVQMIDKSATGLLNILDDILEYCTLDSTSNQEMGPLVLQSVKFDILELVEKCMTSYTKAVEDKGLLFFLLFKCHESNYLGDPWGIKQILSHLIGNAIKFTEKGCITVMLHAEKQHKLENSWKLFLTVEDTGIGIPKDKINHLFGVFTQADQSNTRIHGGVGLGLSMSKDLAEIMNGEVTVESKEGGGSRFTLTFLSTSFPSQGPNHAELGKGLEEKCRIIYIHSCPICRNVISDQLSFCNFKFDVAISVGEAWDIYCQQEPDFTGVTLIMADAACIGKDDSLHEINVSLEDKDRKESVSKAVNQNSSKRSPLPNHNEDSTLLDNICKFFRIFFSSNTYFILFSTPSFTTALHITIDDYIRDQLSCLAATPILPTQLIDSILDNVERFYHRIGNPTATLNSRNDTFSSTDMAVRLEDLHIESPGTTTGVSSTSTNQSIPSDHLNMLLSSDKIHVLLAEDNLVNQKVARLHLEKLGCSVETANNGQEAIDFYFNQPSRYRCIFMDLQMPLIDGHQATRSIRDYEQENHLSRVPICALTANATSDVRAMCLENGFDDFISKPFRRNDLKRILLKTYQTPT